MNIKEIKKLADVVIKDNVDLHNQYLAMENMVHGIWALPGDLEDTEGVHKVVNNDPYNAMNALRRVMSKDLPKIKMHPLAPNLATRDKTDNMERGLKWMYKQLSKRRETDLTADLAWASGLYGQIIGETIFVPDEIEAYEAMGADTSQLKRWMALSGPFMVDLHNPRNAFVFRNGWVNEGLLTRKTMRIQEALGFWGKRASGLEEKLNGLSPAEQKRAWVTIFDYRDDKERYVWGVVLQHSSDRTPTEHASPIETQSSVTIMERAKHEKPFPNWFGRITGNGMESQTEYKVNPMLKTIVDTGLWDTANSVETMIMSKAIKLFGRSGLAEEGPNPLPTEQDFDAENMGDILKVSPGNTIKPLAQEVLDEALLLLSDRTKQEMDRSTVSRLLQTGEFPAGTAASAINIITQSALESIGPFKRHVEGVIEDILSHMLMHIHYSGEALVVDGAASLGQPQIIIEPADINPDYIYIDAELTAVMPTDMVARANAGRMMTEMGFPRARVLEQQGVQDPLQAMKEARQEQFLDAKHAQKLARIEMETQLEMQAAQMQMQMQAQQMAQQQQQQVQGSAQPPGTPLSGDGFNQAAGGQSVNDVTNASFENQTGQARDGTPLPA